MSIILITIGVIFAAAGVLIVAASGSLHNQWDDSLWFKAFISGTILLIASHALMVIA